MTSEKDYQKLKLKLMKRLKKRKIKYIEIPDNQTLDLICDLYLNNNRHDCDEPIYLLYAALYENRIAKKYEEAEKYLIQIEETENTTIRNRALEELGYIMFKKKKYYLAEKYFLMILNNNSDTHIRLNLITIYLRQKKNDQIYEHLSKFNEKNSSNRTLIKVADICKDMNETKLERKYLLMSYHKGNKYASHKLSYNYLRRLEYSLAEKYAKKTLSFAGKFRHAFSILIMSLLEQKKYEEAEKHCLDRLENWSFHALYLLALVYQDQNKFDLAESNYLKAIEKGSISSMRNLIKMYSYVSPFESSFRKNYKEGDFKVVNMNPKYSGYYFESKYGEHKLSELINKYALMACEHGCQNSMIFMANKYENHEKYDLANEYYLKAVDKGLIYALQPLAMMYAKKGEDDLVEKYCSMMVSKNSVYLMPPIMKYYRRNQKDNMIKKIFTLIRDYYLKRVKENPRNFKVLASFYDDFDKLDLARKFYLLAYEHGCKNPGVLTKMAWMYVRHRQYDVAEKCFTMAADEYYSTNKKKKYVTTIKNMIKMYKKYKCFEFIEKIYLSSIEKIGAEYSKDLMYDLVFLYKKHKNFTLANKYLVIGAKYYHSRSIIIINSDLVDRFNMEIMIDVSNILNEYNHQMMNDVITFIENNKDSL